MKRFLFMALLAMGVTFSASAQLRPTTEDIGKDCTTEDGKLGVWREVTVTETVSYSNSESSSSSSSSGISANASASTSFGNSKIGSVEASVGGSVENSWGNSQSYGAGSTNSETHSYKEIMCKEDRSANLPQQTPVRW